MKKIFTLAAALFIAVTAFGQAVLPTFWSFNGTAPNGWTTSGTTTYSTSPSALSSPSCKLSGTGQYVQIATSDAMGPVTYAIKGNTTAGPFTGTFTVQESVNGTTWTTLHNFVDAAIDINQYVNFSDNPNSASRYIRFFFTNKVSGWNIGLDSVGIAIAPPSPAQEINVKQGTTAIPSGLTAYHASPIGTNTPLTLTVENLGLTNTLNISGATITGSTAFTVSSFPATVAATSSASLVVNFTPPTAGTFNSILSIANNDANENPYIINLYGVGGSLASEPTAQGTALNFTGVKSYRFNAAFAAASPAPEGYLVLMKQGSAITDVPTDGVIYTRGDNVGASKVVYAGTATSFVPKGIYAGLTYNFAVYAYNGPGTFRNYLQTAPLIGNVTTSAVTMITPTYYTGLSSTSPTFVTDLHNKINPHTSIYYSNFEETNIALFHHRDTTNDQRVATCNYTGEAIVYSDPFDWTATGMSREHSFCQSWMPTYSILQSPTELPEYDDQHALFPVDQNNANVHSSNYPLGKVITPTFSFMEGKVGLDSVGHTVYEPRDEQKGNSARAIFYMCVCYNGVSGNNWRLPSYISSVIPYGQDQEILKKWHYMDPPDAWEKASNDFIDSLQHNRNPFIDSTDWVCYIDFTTMTKITNPSFPCNTAPIGQFVPTLSDDNSVQVYPNPGNGRYTVELTTNATVSARITNILGKELSVMPVFNAAQGIDLSAQPAGIYFLELRSGTEVKVIKLVKE